jgi:hypothetical protein
MDFFAGLDVSVKETNFCIVDDTGKIVREARVASEPEALLQVLTNTIYRFKRVGLEAGPLSQWLYNVLAEAGLPVICVETRHMRAVRMPSGHSPKCFAHSVETQRVLSEHLTQNPVPSSFGHPVLAGCGQRHRSLPQAQMRALPCGLEAARAGGHCRSVRSGRRHRGRRGGRAAAGAAARTPVARRRRRPRPRPRSGTRSRAARRQPGR